MHIQQETIKRIDLTGIWSYQLDRSNSGIKEEWFKDTFPNNATFKLPGTTSDNQVGDMLEDDWEFNKEAVRSLRAKYRYTGVIWFQREIVIPIEWDNKQIHLFLERVMFQSQVWINGHFVGVQDSLSIPHIFDLSVWVKPGTKNVLTIRVDNQDIHNIGEYPSAYTDETQTIWNGIIGNFELRCRENIYCSHLQVFPNIRGGNIKVKAAITNQMEIDSEILVKLDVQLAESQVKGGVGTFETKVYLSSASETILECEIDIKHDLVLWDEFSPHLYTLNVSIMGQTPMGVIEDYQSTSFGMRDFRCHGTQFEVNHKKTFLRGTLDCCVFPLTGYPPTNYITWKEIFLTVKEYGLNHVRFHSWCPPEAAFDAADNIGVYLQVEGPVWMDTWNMPVGSKQEHYDYLPLEAKRIIETYGNHPSFCMFSVGNELNGDFQLLHSIIDDLKKQDDRHVYTLTANWDRPLDSADDFFIAQTVDGVGVRGQYFLNEMVDSTQLDFKDAISHRDVPVVSHEIGQYCVYPEVNKIDKYTGLLRPINLEVIKKDLQQKSLFTDVEKFIYGSGKLAVQLYRDEIEAALRTPMMGGFQLLDLHDFPGQSTATVGVLDAFWDSKGLIDPKHFREFCGPTVLLLKMPKRIYRNNEEFHAAVEVSHYGNEDLSGKRMKWMINGADGSVYDSGILSISDSDLGNSKKLGNISTSLHHVEIATKLNIVLTIEDSEITNNWDIWVYPSEVGSDEEKYCSEKNIVITEAFDADTEKQLEQGGNVLLLLNKDQLVNAQPGKFFPVFWSPVHFTSENPCGIYVDKKHPIFNSFPTDSYASYQWKDLLEKSVSIDLDGLSCNPIVQVIPNFYHNKKLSNLLEFKIGNGRLLVCSLDITTHLSDRAAARQLRKSILQYMGRDDFNPANNISFNNMKKIIDKNKGEDSGHVLPGEELAIGKTSISDSERLPEHAATKGNDGVEDTFWCAADEKTGHWWQVDFGMVKEIYGTRLKFLHPANYLYVLQASSDGEKWRTVVNQTGNTVSNQIRIDRFNVNTRYLRIVYNGVPTGIKAGHYQFEVYGN